MRRIADFLPALGLTMAWLVPVHFPPWVTWHSEVPVFAAVLLAATLGVAATTARRGLAAQVRVPTMTISLIALAALALAQAAAGIVRFYGEAWVVVLYLVLCAVAFELGHATADERSRVDAASDALAWTLLAAGLGCTIIALVQALDVWESSEWIVRTPTFRRSGANLGQPNQMATLLLMAAASLAFLHELGRIGRGSGVLLGMVLATGLATTESRTGLLSMAMLAAWWFCRGYRSRLRPPTVVLAIVLVVLLYLLWPPLLEAFHGDVNAEAARVNMQVGLRAIVWPQLLEAVAQKPWLGWGVRQTSVALTSVVHAHAVSEPYTYAHNIILELILAFGGPIAVLLLAGAAAWVWRRRDGRNDMVGWYCMALWVPLGIHSLLEFPYSYAYLLAPAMFALGLLDSTSHIAKPGRIPMAVLAAVLVGTWVLAAWSVVDYMEVEEDFRVARFESGRIGVTPPDYQRPRLHLLTQLGAMVEGARITPRPGMAPEQVTFAGDVAAHFPWPALQNRYALALALNGQPAAAERELRVILAMHGEGLFRDIRLNWKTLETEKYPQLGKLHMPEAPPPVSAMR